MFTIIDPNPSNNPNPSNGKTRVQIVYKHSYSYYKLNGYSQNRLQCLQIQLIHKSNEYSQNGKNGKNVNNTVAKTLGLY